MISIWLGGVGSGKTACVVREMKLNKSHRLTYSNIETQNISNNKVLNRDMIIENEVIGEKKDGTEIFKQKLNQKFWQKLQKKGVPLNVILDEAHTLMNPRRAMSKINIILSDFMALLRRILGASESGYGELILLTQLRRRLDPIAREMATQFRYHRCHYFKTCTNCGTYWQEHNELPEPLFECPVCHTHKIKKHRHVIEVWCFNSEDAYLFWKEDHRKTYYKRYYVMDIEEYFPLYDTLQWDNLISEY